MTKTEVRENWDAKLIANLALSGVAGLLGSALVMISPLRLVPALPMALTSGFNLALARHYAKRREVGLGMVATAAADLAGDYLALADSVPVDPDLVSNVVISRIAGTTEAERLIVNTRGTDWFSHKFIRSNVCFIGGAGSGKSVNARHLVDSIVADPEHDGLEAIFGLISTHYEREPANALDRWFPGVDPEMLTGIVVKQPGLSRSGLREANWQRLLAFERLMEQRMEAEDTTAPMRWLVVDDFQYQFPDDKLKDAAKVIEGIVDEGRKYNLRLILVLHSLKTKQITFDSSVLWSMAAVIFQSALGDPNVKGLWPPDIQGKVKGFEDTLAAEARALGGQWRVALVRPGSLDCGWDGAEVKALPDRATSGYVFELEERPWIDTVSDALLAAIEAGQVSSFTAATKRVGITRRHKKRDGSGDYQDPKAQALWEWWQENFDVITEN